MFKVLIGALFVTTTALAQTQQTQTPQTKSDAKRAGVAVKPTGSTESTTKSKSASATTASMKPLPQPSMKEKLESGDNNIPTYKLEKDAGVHKGRAKYKQKQNSRSADVNAMTKKGDQ